MTGAVRSLEEFDRSLRPIHSPRCLTIVKECLQVGGYNSTTNGLRDGGTTRLSREMMAMRGAHGAGALFRVAT